MFAYKYNQYSCCFQIFITLFSYIALKHQQKMTFKGEKVKE